MDTKYKQVDVVPMVKHYISELGLYELFERYIPNGNGAEIAPAQVLCLMITNIIVATKPLYRVDDWLSEYMDGKGERVALANKYNDDRLARTLDYAFDADRASLMTEVSAAAIRVHDLETQRIHNDSTSISFSGAYEGQHPEAVQLEYGFNKDHRPDYKQIVFGLNITEDGHVPLSYQLYDGSQADVTTHIPNWNQLREFLAEEPFIYTADCKLCSTDNLQHIDSHGGLFITLMPKNRKEVSDFQERLRQGEVIPWAPGYRTENSRQKGTFTDYRLYDADCSREGYRIIWIHSSSKALQDGQTRERQMAKAEATLTGLSERLNTYTLKSRDAIEKAVNTACAGLGKLLPVEIKEEKIIQRVKRGRGRPGPNSQYIEKEQTLYHLQWQRNPEAIERAGRADGVFPLVTNANDFPAVDVLQTYKKQPFLEKRFHTKKSVLEVAPVFLKKNERIEAMVFLYFIALMIVSLMERHIRREMATQGIESLPILPSRLHTKTPTWNNIRYLFRNIHLALIVAGTQTLQASIKGVTELHRLVLRLLKVPLSTYLNLQDAWWNFDDGIPVENTS